MSERSEYINIFGIAISKMSKGKQLLFNIKVVWVNYNQTMLSERRSENNRGHSFIILNGHIWKCSFHIQFSRKVFPNNAIQFISVY